MCIAESEELREKIEDKGGISYILDHKVGQKIIRDAIIVFEKYELTNLDKYGDVLFIDTTNFANKNSWSLTPITLVDSNLKLISGGCMFHRFSNSTVFNFFLENLSKVAKKAITIVTDEDLALMSSIEEHNASRIRKICHIICAWHKTANFEKKLKEIIKDKLS